MKNTSHPFILHFAFFAIFILAFCQGLKAQQTICTTVPSTNHCEYDPNWNNQNEPGPFYIRTFVHVVRDANGTGGQSESQVQEALSYLDQAFNPHNIFFVPDCEIDYIDDHHFYILNGTPEIFTVNNHPNGIDIYLFPDFPFPVNIGGGKASDVCSKEFYVSGNFWLPPYTSIVRSYVISHEMGHCLGLKHTFGSAQIVNDPNCNGGVSFTPLGDFICDTPPDPNMDYDVNPATCQWGGSGNDQNGVPYNPDETNIMAYSHVDCQDSFSEGQGQLMRNIIANLQLLQDCLISTLADPSIPPNPIPTTWSATEYMVSGTLNIESGATLIISAGTTVRFAEGSRVVINPNANLILFGTLTSFCDLTWKGVEVWGNSNASQVQQGGVLSQGKFIGREGSVVENAETAAQLWGPDFDGAGGQIICTGTTFKNNIIGINAASYQNFWPHSFPPGWLNKPLNYVGSFTGCNFETNNEYPHSSKFFAFANLASVNGFRFSGCHFENTQEHQDCNDISDFGFGIFAQNAGFTVNGQCLDIFLPCANYNRSLFKGLGYGIHSQTLSQNRPYIVEMSDFEDCFFGIYQNEITGATVVGNNFLLGNLPNTGCTTDQFGAVLSMGTNGITFQENRFLKVPGNATKTVGTYSIRLGLFDNVIRRNTYDGITFGNIASGQCGNSNPISTGLLYECNKNFNIEQYDFIAQKGIPGLGNAFIRRIQGLSTQDAEVFIAAGNKFSYTGVPLNSDFLGQGPITGDFPQEYYYNPVAANEEPQQFGLIVPEEGEPNTCAPEYCIPPCMEPYEVDLRKSQFYSNSSNYQVAKTAYQMAINTGNYALAQTKANEAGFARQEMDKAAHMVLLHTMYDSVTYHRDTLRTWLSNVNTYDSEILLSKDYLDADQFAQAQYILSQLPGKFGVTASDLSDLQSLSSIYTMIEQNKLLGLDENDLASLSVIAHGDLSYSTNLARGILELYRIEFFHPELYDVEERSDSRNQEKAKHLQLSEKDAFKVYPNPTTDILFISGTFTDLVLKLTNVSGGTVLLRNLTDATRQQGLAVRHLPDGLYFYEIFAQNGKDKLQHGKIIIKK